MAKVVSPGSAGATKAPAQPPEQKANQLKPTISTADDNVAVNHSPAVHLKFKTTANPPAVLAKTAPPTMPNEMQQLDLKVQQLVKDAPDAASVIEPGAALDKLKAMGWDGTGNPHVFLHNQLQCMSMLWASTQAAAKARPAGEAADLNPVPAAQMASRLNAAQNAEAFAPSPKKAAALKRKASAIDEPGPSATQQDLQAQINAQQADLNALYGDLSETVAAATANGSGDRKVPYGLKYLPWEEPAFLYGPPAPNGPADRLQMRIIPGQEPAHLSAPVAPPLPKRNKTGALTSPTGNDYNPYGNELKIASIPCFDGILAIRNMKNSRQDGFNNYLRQEIRNPNSTILGTNIQICELRDHSSGKILCLHNLSAFKSPLLAQQALNTTYSPTGTLDRAVLQCTKRGQWPLLVFIDYSHEFETMDEAVPICLQAMERFHDFCTNPAHLGKRDRYTPVSTSNILKDTLVPLSDIICYSDTFKIFHGIYNVNGQLPAHFGTQYPHIVRKYFPDFDKIPKGIKAKLGLPIAQPQQQPEAQAHFQPNQQPPIQVQPNQPFAAQPQLNQPNQQAQADLQPNQQPSAPAQPNQQD
jgi:hypothetical protein